MTRKTLTCLVASAVIAIISALPAMAMKQEEIDAITGPAFGISGAQITETQGKSAEHAAVGEARSEEMTGTVETAQNGQTANTENSASANITTDEAGIEHGTPGALIGRYRTTGYCACSKCCGSWSGGPTASGNYPRANHTVGADIAKLPFGTKIMFEGSDIVYTVEDIGPEVYVGDPLIDVFYATHAGACAHGLTYVNVYYAQ